MSPKLKIYIYFFCITKRILLTAQTCPWSVIYKVCLMWNSNMVLKCFYFFHIFKITQREGTWNHIITPSEINEVKKRKRITMCTCFPSCRYRCSIYIFCFNTVLHKVWCIVYIGLYYSSTPMFDIMEAEFLFLSASLCDVKSLWLQDS